MTKYYCDHCGKETSKTNLVSIEMNTIMPTPQNNQFFRAEVCQSCADILINWITDKSFKSHQVFPEGSMESISGVSPV